MKLAICVPTYNRSDVVEELLVRYMDILNKFYIDLYIFDSSENDTTKKGVKKYGELSNHIFYHHIDSSVHSNLKVYKIYQNTELIERYDYIWVCSDAIRWSEKVFEKIFENLNDGYDFIIPDYMDYDKIGDRKYFNCVEIFRDLAWYMTLYGATIASTGVLKKIKEHNWKEYERLYCEKNSINFSHVLFYFDYMRTVKNLQVKHLSFSGGELEASKLRKKSGWHQETFLIWCKYWRAAINKLPDIYSNELKKKVIKMHGIYSEIFSKENLLSLRECKIYNFKVWMEYSLSWKNFCDLSSFYLLRVALIPTGYLTRKKTRNIERLKKLLLDFSENYSRIYVYGAGQKGKLFTDVLKKLNVDIEGYLVSGIVEHQTLYYGKTIDKFSHNILENKENGVIIGLNKQNENEVVKAILRAGNRNQILYGLSDYDKFCLQKYLER